MDQQDHNFQMDYIEFPATDIEATKRFYSAVFGWNFTDYGPNYTSFFDGRLGGGFTMSAQPVKGGALVVLYAKTWKKLAARSSRPAGRSRSRPSSFPADGAFILPIRMETNWPCGASRFGFESHGF